MNVNFAPLASTLALPAASGASTALASTGSALAATTARDAVMPELASTTASANSLQSLAASLLGSSGSASASSASIPAPALPSAVDHGSHDEAALHEDLGGNDDASADPSQTSISA
jgi:hypothetical protein